MKKFLLLICGLLSLPLVITAHTTDPTTIIYDDDELVTENDSTSTRWNSNGNIPPQPEADYYVNMQNAGNVYYRLLPVEGSSPTEYSCNMPILQGNFKIYAKEYWTMRGTSGYDQNKYIYGSQQHPTGFDRDTYKNLGNPGGDLQIEGGGTWYGCTLSFWPTGHSGNGTPDLMITGGAKDTQMIAITATGAADGPTSGHVDFTISTGGVVKPTEQTYTVTMTFTPDGATTPTTLTQDVKGLTGSFTDIEGLPVGATTTFTLTASIKQAPVFSNPSQQESISGYKDLTSEETTATITTFGKVYLVGNITGIAWDPTKATEGVLLNTLYRDYPESGSIYAWIDVPLTGDMRFRFVSQPASWTVLESQGTQYYPTSSTVYCNNVWDDLDTSTGNWYEYTEGLKTDNAWAPNAVGRGLAGEVKYNVYFNMADKKVAVGWSTSTAVNDLTADPAGEPVDVYNLQGIMVRHHIAAAEAIVGLPHGIYIIGDKKVAVN